MASNTLDTNGDCVDDIVDQLLPPAAYEAGNPFGEPEILPRIGDEYQAELPPLIAKSNYMSHPHQKFIIGLPMPVTWISSLKHEAPQIISGANGEIDPSRDLMKHIEESQNLQKCCDEGYLLVPGLISKCWSDAEKASFVLGLYIFQKNFVEVKQFIETKEMGEILSFYYGRFYGSDEYSRWSECRKTKSKRRVHGQRLFTGLRQQELLSRLLPRVSEECQSALLEVSKAFGGEKISLVDYVSSLKAISGMNTLVEAIAIGSGKQDLTRMALEPSRSNRVIPVRPELPTGKECSSLTTSEIIKFLSGDYRLSKGRSNDLFWEAVWPRLLARGWHSEKPKNYVSASNHGLVFLMPDVKKFSRKLVKGDHYFDSVTDVLSKVSKEPGLIELDNEEADGVKNDEHELISERKMEEDENDLSEKKEHFYLQPRTHNRSVDSIKFMVVETCLSDGKVRELRTLPPEISLTRPERNEDSNPRRKNHDDNSSYQENHTVYPAICKASNLDLKKEKKKKKKKKKKKDLNDKKKVKKVLDPLAGLRKQGNVDYIAPISKRCRRLTANSHEEKGDGLNHPSTSLKSENGMSCCCSVDKSNENLSSQVVSSCQDKLPSIDKIERDPIINTHAREPSPSNPQTRFFIDLNLPQVSPEFENGDLDTDMKKEEDNMSIKPDDDQCLPKSLDIEVRSEQHSIMNPQRHSKRNRPLTNRALEAIAHGYLTVNRKMRKSRDASSYEDLPSISLQLSRGMVGPSESPNSSLVSNNQEAENAAVTNQTEANEEPAMFLN